MFAQKNKKKIGKTKDRKTLNVKMKLYIPVYMVCLFGLTDILRCSVIFYNPRDLIIGLNKFVSIVSKQWKVGNPKLKGCLFKVARIKNGFADISHWRKENNLSNYNYCDIKANVIVEYNNVRMIAEVQFGIFFMLEAKKLGIVCIVWLIM